MDKLKNIKSWIIENKSDLILASSFFLIAIISFGLGRLSILIENQRKEPISIEFRDNITNPATKESTPKSVNREAKNVSALGALIYVGSKNSNKYHLPDCPGALRIKEENKIWFSSKKEAESLGYTPASNCEGL